MKPLSALMNEAIWVYGWMNALKSEQTSELMECERTMI